MYEKATFSLDTPLPARELSEIEAGREPERDWITEFAICYCRMEYTGI